MTRDQNAHYRHPDAEGVRKHEIFSGLPTRRIVIYREMLMERLCMEWEETRRLTPEVAYLLDELATRRGH